MDEFWKMMAELTLVGVLLWGVILGGLYFGGGSSPVSLQGVNPISDPASDPTGTPTATERANRTGTPTSTATPTSAATPTPSPTPTARDSDADGLTDERERELGTDPDERDTDGDDIPDEVEVRGETADGVELRDADPLRMDLYVVTYWSLDAHPPTSYDVVTERFADMPVENPDGSTGIDLHVERAGLIDRPLVYDGTEDSRDTIFSYAERRPYHHYLVVVQFEDDSQLGYATSPGERVLINEQVSNEDAPIVVVHELLHNVLGEIDASGACEREPKHYCEGGYMEPDVNERSSYLPEELADQIEEEGFRP